MTPKVSICIPTYKQTEFLKKTLDSLFSQTFTDYELIVSDDSPSDTVEKIIDQYKIKFGEKLHYYKNTPALGSPENWNSVMSKATGEYIKILHHDDWFTYPESLAIFIDEMDKKPFISFGFSASSSYNASKNETTKNYPSKRFLADLKKDPSILFFGNLVGAPSVTIFRNPSIIKFDRKLKWVVDVDFYIRTVALTNNFVYINNNLITSVSGVAHSITNECMNKETQVFEYVYLYNSLKLNKSEDKRYIDFFSSLFMNYNIDLSELKKITGLSEFDSNMQKALLFKSTSKFKKIVKKVKQKIKSLQK